MKAKDYRRLKRSIKKSYFIRVDELKVIAEEHSLAGKNSKKFDRYMSQELEAVEFEYTRAMKKLERTYHKGVYTNG